MRDGFLSEVLAIGGFYLATENYFTAGILCIVASIFGGAIRYFHKVSRQDAKENRASEIFDISKTVLIRLLHAINDTAAEEFKKDETVH